MNPTFYASKFFLRPYEDSNNMSIMQREIDGITYTIYRPNHGLAHSMRQGFLAKDIIYLLMDRGYPISKWINEQLDSDKYFVMKVFIISTFQRSGRQSEVSSKYAPELYKQYQDMDMMNFKTTAIESNLFNGIFKCMCEVERWSNTLRWEDTSYLSMILKGSHTLDLRRIPKFDTVKIKRETKTLLCICDCDVSTLWERSNKYITATGDRNSEPIKKDWSDKFFILQQNIDNLYESLINVR